MSKPETKDRIGLDAKDIALRPRNFEELWRFAQMVADTDYVPPADRGKPGQVIAKVQYGNEIGLPAMQSLQWIAVINGKPALFGDGFWMLVKSHPLCQWTKETTPQEALRQGYAEVTIMRKGDPEPTTRQFTMEEAKRAGLIERSGPKGPWSTYPGEMLVWKARHRCTSAAIPEAVGGLMPADVARDIEVEALKTPLAIGGTTDEQARPSAVDRVGDSKAPEPDRVAAASGDEPEKIEEKRERSGSDQERITAFLNEQSAEFFQDSNNLTPLIKGIRDNKVLTAVCRVFNDRKKELAQ